MRRLADHKDYLKNIFTLFSGSAMEHMIPLLIAPVLSRLYTPVQFGIYALFISIASIFTIIATGRYEMAVMLPEKDRDAINVIYAGLSVSAILAVFTLAGAIVVHAAFHSWFSNPDFAGWLYLVPLSVISFALYQVFNIWFSRMKRFRLISVMRITCALVIGGVNVIAGVLKLGAIGLIAGFFMGPLVAGLVYLGIFWFSNRDIIPAFDRAEVLGQARKYRDFLRINSLHSLMDMVNLSLLNFLIAGLYGNAILGLYSFTFKNIRGPLRLVALPVGQIFYQKASEMKNRGESLSRLLKINMAGAMLLGLPVLLILLFFGPSLFSFIFGPEWRVAGVYARIMAPMMFINFVTSPFGQLPLTLNLQKPFFLICLVGFAGSILMFLAGHYLGQGFNVALAAYTAGYSALLIVLAVWYLRITGRPL